MMVRASPDSKQLLFYGMAGLGVGELSWESLRLMVAIFVAQRQPWSSTWVPLGHYYRPDGV